MRGLCHDLRTNRRNDGGNGTAFRLPPFLLFLSPGENTFSADNLAYFSCKQLDLELYTDKKLPELEEQVEAVLAQHEIYYTKTELFIDSEELYEVLYEMEV